MADYNAWMNAKVYDAAALLSPEALTADRGAFFGSVLGTLNHLVVGDTLWLKRFALHPASRDSLSPITSRPTPTSLRQIVHTDLADLRRSREWLDALIVRWIDQLDPAALQEPLHYRNTRGEPQCKRLDALLQHFFNHQTHHRGQASTLLHQAGLDIGVTDLLARIPNESGAACVTESTIIAPKHEPLLAGANTPLQTEAASRTGACLCGTIVFEVSDAPRHIYQCHCSLCRRQGGAAGNAGMIVYHRQVRWISGHDRVSTYRKSSGFRADFCSACGSPVPNPIGDSPYTWVPVGLLDSSEGLTIALHLFMGSKAAWDPTPTAGTLHDTMPSLQTLLAVLHAP